jgi:hypothetical protein
MVKTKIGQSLLINTCFYNDTVMPAKLICANSTKFSSYPLVYCKLDQERTGAYFPRGSRARDFVNFREKKFMHRARPPRPLGIDSLPSLDSD